METWKDIPGFEGFYQASDLGRIKSNSRIVMRGNGAQQTVRERILKPCLSQTYQNVVLSKGGKTRTHTVHTLVMLAFNGPAPEGNEVCHYDGDCHNNCLSNLRYDTRKGNHRDMLRHGTHPGLRLR